MDGSLTGTSSAPSRPCSESAGGKTTPRTSPPGFSRLALTVVAASPSDVAVSLGRIPAGASGRIWLQSLLRALPTLAQEAGCSSSPGTPVWREGLRGLGRCHDSGARSGYRRNLASVAVRDCVGHEFLHLCRSHFAAWALLRTAQICS
jgi:hypothetical protein